MTTALTQKLAAASKEVAFGCVEWVRARNARGYGVTNWVGKKMLAHRAAWVAAHGPIPDDLHVLHRCDNPCCIKLGHLFLGTPADNCRDKIQKGRARWGNWPHKGEKSPTAKLTEAQAIEIKRSRDTQSKVASRFGISQQTVSDILSGRRWQHLAVAS